MSDTNFKPSAVVLLVPPLVDTLGSSELEHAAALLVFACAKRGDAWQALLWEQAQETLRAAYDAKEEPIYSLLRNPFFKPDFHKLCEQGFARWLGEPEPGKSQLKLTPQGIARLAKWVRP